MNRRTGSRTFNFVVVSVLTHVALAAGVLSLNVNRERLETAVVDLISEDAPLPEMEVSEAPEYNETPQEAQVTEVVALPTKAVAPAKPAKVAKPAPPVQKLPEAKHQAKEVTAEPAPEEVQEDSPVVIPVAQPEEPVQEQPAPQEEQPPVPVATETPSIEEETEAKVAAAKEEMDKKAEEELKEKEAQVAALKKQNEEEAKRLEQEQALAAKQAEEARQAEAARLAEEARIAQTAAITGSAVASGNGGGYGEVRALEDLRQMPGNKRPQYDADDRYNRREGEVAFKAYVSKEGSLTEFKLTKSSGHRALDAKTLKALKSWKFQPGQEGWVEIPFQWSLKGDPTEKSALRLKSQASQN